MSNEINYSILNFDNLDLIPFPDCGVNFKIKENWLDYSWQVYNAPLIGAKYSILGRTLYLDELPEGESITKKQESFYGEVKIATYFITNNVFDKNYILIFKLIFIKGEMADIRLDEYKTQSKLDFSKKIEVLKSQEERLDTIINSWWFKYIYVPYFYFIRFVFGGIVWWLELIKDSIVYIINKITPI